MSGTNDRPDRMSLALVGEADDELAAAVAPLGSVTRLGVASAFDPCVHDIAVVDCLGARRAGGERALRALAPTPAIVLAVVAPETLAPPDAWPEADEVVLLAELASPTLLWRLERRVAERHAPCALSPRWRPRDALLQAIADHSSDWLFVKDLEHRFVLAGTEFARTVGRPLEAIVGEDDLGIGSDERSVLGDASRGWPGFWPQDDEAIASGRVMLEENPEWDVFSESPRHKRTFRVPLANARGEIHALLVCSQDVTRVHEAEHALAEGQERLDAETRARRAAERAADARTNFLATATHDLRQPLHAIGLFVESLSRELETPRQRTTLAKIRRGVETLATLFDALLDITRLDAALVEVDRRDVALERVLAPLREAFVAEGAAKGLGVSIDTSSATVFTDPVLLGRVLRNLLSNAVRYTAEGGVRLETRTLGRALEIRVRDSGPGIDPSEHEAIFTEYYRTRRAAGGAPSGLGLGLAIVRRIATLLGTPLALESRAGQGTTFSVRVPLGDARRAGVVRAAAAPAIGPDRVVLVVDDEEAIRDGMADVFRASGCRTVVASGAHGALASLARHALAPDIVVADHRLGGEETGVGAIEAVRDRYGPALPGVIVTGDTAPERLREARREGYAFLHKPVAPQELLRVVAGLLATAGFAERRGNGGTGH